MLKYAAYEHRERIAFNFVSEGLDAPSETVTESTGG
jgi:hypothetical protein